GDPVGAAALLGDALTATGEAGLVASTLALELLASSADVDLDAGHVLTRRLALLAEDAGALREAHATRYLLATHHAEVGEHETAATALAKLASTGEGEAGAWGARLATLTGLRLALASGDVEAVTRRYRDLAESNVGR